MRTYLVAPLVLATSASGALSGFDASSTAVPPQDVGSSTAATMEFVRGGVDVFSHLSASQREDVRRCGLGHDVTLGIQAAVAAANASGSSRVVLPDGCYRTSATITLPSNLELVGASMHGTKVMPTGNFPAILAAGTYAHGLVGVGVQNMSIVCAGMSNANAMGIKLIYVNRGNLRDLYLNGCRHGLDLYDQWQTRIDNISVDGMGAQQNQVGVYMGAPTDAANKAPNNAVILSNSTMQNVALYGYQLVFFAGSKFINDEAMNGVTGWKLCGEPYMIAGQACQFGHFNNIVADTTSGPGIVVDQGANADPVNNVMFDHVWIGSSTVHGLYLAGVTYSQFDNIHVTRTDNGVYLHNSHNVKISANVAQYNRNDNHSHAAVISGGSNNTLWATNSQSDHPTGYNGIKEVGPTRANSIWGGLASCNLKLLFGSVVAARGPAYANRSCEYEVQGRQVRMTFRLALSGLGSSSGAALLKGLPFAVDNGAAKEGAVNAVLAQGMAGLEGMVVAQAMPGKTAARLFSQGAKEPVALRSGNFSASSKLSGKLEYTKK